MHCHTQNRKALGPNRRRRYFFIFFPLKAMGANDPRVEPFLTPGAWLAGFIKRITIHCFTQNMKALGLMVSEKKIFLYSFNDAPATVPVWTPEAWLAEVIQRTTIHCYT